MGFEQSSYTLLESEGQAIVCVRINASLERNVTVHLSTIAATAQCESLSYYLYFMDGQHYVFSLFSTKRFHTTYGPVGDL